jgi:hypothetical protein
MKVKNALAYFSTESVTTAKKFLNRGIVSSKLSLLKWYFQTVSLDRTTKHGPLL